MSSPNRRFPPLVGSLLPRMQLKLPGADLLTGLIIVLALIHLLLWFAGGAERAPEYYINFGLSWDSFSQGKIWQLGTYGLLHANAFHLLMNLLMLWLVGGRVVHILGYRRCFQIIAFGVLCGGLLHLLTGLLMLRAGHHESQLVGISGACIALLLTLTTISPDSRMWPIPISGKNLGLGLIVAELLLWLMQPGLGLPGFSKLGEKMALWGGEELFLISHACHLGGALAGWWLARRLLAPMPDLETLQQMRQEREEEVDCGDLG